MVPPPALQGRRSFRFRRKIGSGAFGEVYLAEMITGGGFAKVVAVKVLKPEFLDETDIVSRMRDEARLLGHLRHPAIVQADDLLMLGGRVAIVMEYVPGANLLWLIHPRQNPDPLPPAVLAAIIGRVAEALDAAWSRPSTLTGQPLRVLHRDIKPSNIRITPDGEVKVLDFGVARSDALERETSTHNQLIGSLTFLAPEVFLSQPVLPATDIYALGVTFFESIARSRFGRCGLSPEYHQERLTARLQTLELDAWGPSAEQIRGLLAGMLAFEPLRRPTSASLVHFCAQICRSLPGPELRDWARDNVERLAGQTKQELEGELVGTTLDEESSQRQTINLSTHATLQPEDEPTQAGGEAGGRRRAVLLAALVLLALLVPALLALGAGLAWYSSMQRPLAVTSQQALAPAQVPPVSPALVPRVADPAPEGDASSSSPAPPASAPSVAAALPPVPSPGLAAAPTPAPAPVEPSTPRKEASAATVSATAAPSVPPPAPARVQAAPPAPTAASGKEAVTSQDDDKPTTGDALQVEVSASRRALRNSQYFATITTGMTGCDVTVFWRTEGQAAWDQAGLAGAGPAYSWTLDVTAEHRPAIQYYVTVTACGVGGVGSATQPNRISVL